MTNFTILLFLFIIVSNAKCQQIEGVWYGNLDLQIKELPLVFHIIKTDTAFVSTIDSPDQNSFDIKTNNMISEDQRSIVGSLTSSWMKFYLKYDPTQALKEIQVPVLAIYGENDLQVPAKENSRVLEEIGNTNIEIIQMDHLNHLFQESKSGLMEEYSKIEQTISPKVLDTISTWILAKS